MKKILINNIGNRHLFYEKKIPNNNYLFNEKKLFRKRTKEILENWEQEKEKLHLNILDQYLQNHKPDKIILIGTDQGKTNINNVQDTIYAAQIIEKILKEKYNIQEVEVKKIRNNPADENKNFPAYSQIFKDLNENEKESNWIFLDAGGTPQQKMVGKLLLPEIHDKVRVDYIKNVEGVEQNEHIIKENTELEKFFIKKNTKALINQGYYESAYQLTKSKDSKNKALPFIKIGKFRMMNIYDKNLNVPHLNKYKTKEKDFITWFQDKKPLIISDDLENLLNKDNVFIYSEFLARADFFLQKEDYNNFVLNFQQSLEVLLLTILMSFAKIEGYSLKGSYNKRKIEDYLILSGYENAGLPNQLDLAIQLSKKNNLNKLTVLLEKYGSILTGYQRNIKGNNKHSHGLDILRNKLVHEGRSIDKNYLKKSIIPTFKNISGLLNLNKNSYDNLNQIIKNNLF